MKIPRKIVEEIEATSVEVHCKVCDSGIYTLKSEDGKDIATREDYVPKFFPGDHHGDYLILEINLETGFIMNWKKPSPADVSTAFGIIENEE